jgi:sRNA-binding carbon storage regulator CsrA
MTFIDLAANDIVTIGNVQVSCKRGPNGRVRVGVNAPRSMKVLRAELVPGRSTPLPATAAK